MQGQPPPLQLPLKRLTERIALATLPQPCDQTAQLLSRPEQAERQPDPAHR